MYEECKELLYRISAKKELKKTLINSALKEIINIEDKSVAGNFISILFTYLMGNYRNVNVIEGLLNIVFENDKFKPYNIELSKKYNVPLILLAGSGKKGIKTINISSASAIVAATLGAKILKPCSKSTSSSTGSSDFFELVGVNINLSNLQTENLINKVGIGLFSIEKLVPKFDKVYGKVFYAPNILSFGLAPLLCPIKPNIIMYGLSNKDIKLSNKVIEKYFKGRIRVFTSTKDQIHYMDELNIFGNSFIYDNNKKNIIKFNFAKKNKLFSYNENDIVQNLDPKLNVKICLEVLQGKRKDAYSEIICLNAGQILHVSGLCKTIEEGYHIAKEVVQSKRCIDTLRLLVKETGGNINTLESLIV